MVTLLHFHHSFLALSRKHTLPWIISPTHSSNLATRKFVKYMQRSKAMASDILKQTHKKNFFFFWLHWVFTAAQRLSLVVMSRNYSVVAVRRLFIAVTSLAVAHDLQHGVAVAHGLRFPVACGIFPDQGSNLCFLQ